MTKKILSLPVFLLLISFLISCTTKNAESESLILPDTSTILKGETPCDIYFATGNNYYDLYPYYAVGPQIMMLSREYIDPETIHISIDIQAEYTVIVTEQPQIHPSLTRYEINETEGTREVTTLSSHANDFPLYLYQNYAGMDWAQLGNSYIHKQSVQEQYSNGTIDIEQLEAELAAYDHATTEYISDYAALTLDDIPQFYGYLIQINFSEQEKEESFQTIHVTVGDKEYVVDIGQVQLRPSPVFENSDNYLSIMAWTDYLDGYPYGAGIEKCQSTTYYAAEALTLTDLDFLENSLSTASILDVTVIIADSLEEAVLAEGLLIPWDGKASIHVQQGKYICLQLTVYDERMKEICYGANLYPVLEFTCNAKSHKTCSTIALTRHWAANWLLYSIGLDGMDMESYFNDYYYVVISNWRKEVNPDKIWSED